MDLLEALQSAGFKETLALDGASCGVPEGGTLVLALWPYEAEKQPQAGEAWIHPYYFASQQAYEAAKAVAQRFPGVMLREDVRVKPVFARLPRFHQGVNTLSYFGDYGSRFHVQILVSQEKLPPTHALSREKNPLHCGACHRCIDACPTNALENGVFHRERCLRNWMMSGQPIPETLRGKMGNCLIGCDVCQRVCPHNPPPQGESHPNLPLRDLLTAPKAAALALRPLIGVNLTLPNRVLGQACLLAGAQKRVDLVDALEKLTRHPSMVVAEHARWAIAACREENTTENLLKPD